MQNSFFYRMNEVLQANNLPLKKVKHSVVIDDYITIEKIQSQNCQYFVESVLEACGRKDSGETVDRRQSKLIKASIENVTIAKKLIKVSTNKLQMISCLIICLMMSLKKLLMIYILKTILIIF